MARRPAASAPQPGLDLFGARSAKSTPAAPPTPEPKLALEPSPLPAPAPPPAAAERPAPAKPEPNPPKRLPAEQLQHGAPGGAPVLLRQEGHFGGVTFAYRGAQIEHWPQPNICLLLMPGHPLDGRWLPTPEIVARFVDAWLDGTPLPPPYTRPPGWSIPAAAGNGPAV